MEATTVVAAVLDDVTRGFFGAVTQACYSAEGWGRSHQGPFRPGEKPQSRHPASMRLCRSQHPAGNCRKNSKSEENRKSSVSARGQMWQLFNFRIQKHSEGPYWPKILTLACLSKDPTKSNTSNKGGMDRYGTVA